ncbi:MAG: ABC transporter substrate-binding protein [Oscillospiraceae bacterium]|jgi:ribose transport system substrate-binding protein|nr:ABC transporter substrate-binding protein [Oscillospiraceae bacterium]MCI1990694.1 ABC transporter substrate-binding protein [Oscillospiraceae bacterium]
MKIKKVLAFALASVMMTAAFAGCSQPAASSSNAANTASGTSQTGGAAKGPIGIVVPSADHGWTAALAYYSQQKCKDLGLTEGSGYKLFTAANANEQASKIEQCITLNCSAIVLDPLNDQVSVAAQKIMDAKIPLIVFDRKVNGSYTAYVAGDNAGMGKAAAKYLGDKLGGKGTIAVMNTPSVGSVNSDRVNGFKEVMQASYPNIKLVDVTESGYTQQAGLKAATDMLVANKQIDAVFSTDDEPSLGILQATKDAKRTDVKYISGGGGNQAYFNKIKEETGISLFTETYSPSMIGIAIQEAHDLINGKEIAEKDKTIPPEFVNKDNVSKYLDSKSPY